MFPSGELKQLELEKQVLLLRGAQLRAECLVAGNRLVRPLNLFLNAAVMAKRLSPLIGAAAFFAPKRSVKTGAGIFNAALRWAPLALRAVNIFKSFRPRS
ncbi:MAG TPA: hypothetical protein VFT72_08845 [Opitutaceae bacterium]|nr:hypothetical protein [Opitutaceae bacterium]